MNLYLIIDPDGEVMTVYISEDAAVEALGKDQRIVHIWSDRIFNELVTRRKGDPITEKKWWQL